MRLVYRDEGRFCAIPTTPIPRPPTPIAGGCQNLDPSRARQQAVASNGSIPQRSVPKKARKGCSITLLPVAPPLAPGAPPRQRRLDRRFRESLARAQKTPHFRPYAPLKQNFQQCYNVPPIEAYRLRFDNSLESWGRRPPKRGRTWRKLLCSRRGSLLSRRRAWPCSDVGAPGPAVTAAAPEIPCRPWIEGAGGRLLPSRNRWRVAKRHRSPPARHNHGCKPRSVDRSNTAPVSRKQLEFDIRPRRSRQRRLRRSGRVARTDGFDAAPGRKPGGAAEPAHPGRAVRLETMPAIRQRSRPQLVRTGRQRFGGPDSAATAWRRAAGRVGSVRRTGAGGQRRHLGNRWPRHSARVAAPAPSVSAAAR